MLLTGTIFTSWDKGQALEGRRPAGEGQGQEGRWTAGEGQAQEGCRPADEGQVQEGQVQEGQVEEGQVHVASQNITFGGLGCGQQLGHCDGEDVDQTTSCRHLQRRKHDTTADVRITPQSRTQEDARIQFPGCETTRALLSSTITHT